VTRNKKNKRKKNDFRVLKERDTATQPPLREIISRTNQRLMKIMKERDPSNLIDSILVALQMAYIAKDNGFVYTMAPNRQRTLKIHSPEEKYHKVIINPLCRLIERENPNFYTSDADIQGFFKDKVEWRASNEF
jgi:hypothetical protein